MKIAIVTGMWRRHEIFEMWAKGVKRLYDRGVEITVIVAGSEGEVSRNICAKHGFTYIEVSNEPLAQKMNATIEVARNLGVDYVLCVGSDDIISVELFDLYIKYMREGFDFIGVLDFYFFDTVSKKASYWGGYLESWRSGHTCGAGRVLSRGLLNKWGWMVWENKHSRILDNSMQDKLKTTPHTSKIFSLKEHGVYGLDIKSDTNMTPFEFWDNTHEINADELLQKFEYIW